ncbi:MAG: sigma factor, partial [Gemmatimonadaceae bacterium]
MLTRPVTGPSFDNRTPLKLVPSGASTKAPVDVNATGHLAESLCTTADTGESADPWRADAIEAASGNRAAFERLYRAHTQRVYSICVRMVSDRNRAEELTQDVFVRVWQKLPTFRGDSA